jgi:hypothetical protein
MARLFAFSLLFGASAEAMLKFTTSSIVRIIPFRPVEHFYFPEKMPVLRLRTSPVLSRSSIYFVRAAS